jgi:hypothetical protein
MGVITLLVICALIGVVAWALTTYLPMNEGVSRAIQIGAVVIVVWMILSAMGLIPHDIQMPRMGG